MSPDSSTAGVSPARTYNAFVSYSRASDAVLARTLQSGLHRFARSPMALRALRVFRDETSLSANPALWTMIATALSQTEFFILLASPAAAESHWVSREVQYWRANKPAGKLLIALTEGEIGWDPKTTDFDWGRTTALPPALAGAFTEEPRWTDLRWARTYEQLSPNNPRFQEVVADFSATIHGRPKDELIGEDVRRRRTTKRLAVGAVTGLVFLTLAASVAAFLAARNAERADDRARLADSRRLAAQSVNYRERLYDVALLLGVEALHAYPEAPTMEARASLFGALNAKQVPHRYLWDPGDEAVDVAFNSDGSLLASRGFDGSLAVWEQTPGESPLSWKSRWRIQGHGPALAVAFGARDQVIAPFMRMETRTTEVSFRSPDGQPVGRPIRIDGLVFDLEVDPSGELLAISEQGGGVTLWSVDSREPISRLPLSDSVPAGRLAFSDDGRLLAAAADDGTISVWRIETREPVVHSLVHPRDESAIPTVTGLVFSRDGRILYSGGVDGYVRRWDISTGGSLGEPERLDDTSVWDLALSRDGAVLISSGGQGVQLSVAASLAAIAGPVPGRARSTTALALHPNGELLATAGIGLIVWQLNDELSLGSSYRGHASRVTAVAASPRDPIAVSSGLDGAIQLWDLNTAGGEPTYLLAPGGSPVLDVALSGNGDLVASAHRDGTLMLWDLASGSKERRFPITGVNVAALAPDGSRVAAGTMDGEIVLVHRPTGTQIRARHADEPAPIDALAFSPDGRQLVSSVVMDRSVRTWDARTLQPVGDPLRVPGPTNVAFSSDGRLLAIASVDGSIFLQDQGKTEGEPGEWAQLNSDTTDPRTSVAFSPDGALLASADTSGRISLWSTANNEYFGSLAVSRYPVWSLAFARQGNTLIVGRDDATISFIDMDPAHWIETACRTANRNLTEEVWRRLMPGQEYRPTCVP